MSSFFLQNKISNVMTTNIICFMIWVNKAEAFQTSICYFISSFIQATKIVFKPEKCVWLNNIFFSAFINFTKLYCWVIQLSMTFAYNKFVIVISSIACCFIIVMFQVCKLKIIQPMKRRTKIKTMVLDYQ